MRSIGALPWTRRAWLGAAASAALCPGLPRAQADERDLHAAWPGTRLRFAGVAQGQAVLAAEDDWMLATGEFQRRAVMGRNTPVSLDEFKRWNAQAVRTWTDEQRARWRSAAAALAPRMSALGLRWPSEVLLVSSNGQESAGAPYTRAQAVVLPDPARMPGYDDESLLAHELWHVLSRRDPALATRLYVEIGFEPTPPLAWPEAWAALRLANPDAPDNRHAMRVVLDGRAEVRLMPVLVAARTQLEPGETFFSVMDVRLLEVEPAPDGRRMRAVLREGAPSWHALENRGEYLRRLGGNTGYVIHPEETIADNFSLLVTGRPARNPALLERIGSALRG